MLVSLPALAQRVTVFGSTRNSTATSPGVIKCSVPGMGLIREICALLANALVAVWFTELPNGLGLNWFMIELTPLVVFTRSTVQLLATVTLFTQFATQGYSWRSLVTRLLRALP